MGCSGCLLFFGDIIIGGVWLVVSTVVGAVRDEIAWQREKRRWRRQRSRNH